MTTRPTTPAPPDLAQHVAWLEQLLKPGMSIARTRHGWYVKRFDSWVDANLVAKMGWHHIDSDSRLEELLARLGEHHG